MTEHKFLVRKDKYTTDTYFAIRAYALESASFKLFKEFVLRKLCCRQHRTLAFLRDDGLSITRSMSEFLINKYFIHAVVYISVTQTRRFITFTVLRTLCELLQLLNLK
jgi:hypothetical protein